MAALQKMLKNRGVTDDQGNDLRAFIWWEIQERHIRHDICMRDSFDYFWETHKKVVEENEKK